ncbi:MAG: hypothetical protein ACYS99_19435, partial [Planctomycetota bacterium]
MDKLVPSDWRFHPTEIEVALAILAVLVLAAGLRNLGRYRRGGSPSESARLRERLLLAAPGHLGVLAFMTSLFGFTLGAETSLMEVTRLDGPSAQEGSVAAARSAVLLAHGAAISGVGLFLGWWGTWLSRRPH